VEVAALEIVVASTLMMISDFFIATLIVLPLMAISWRSGGGDRAHWAFAVVHERCA
jgi:hypothetical protein